MKVPGTSYILSTTVTSGLIANVNEIGTTDIVNFASRFGSTFSEYIIAGCELELIPLTTANGISNFWFDDAITSIPTLNEALGRVALQVSNNSANSKATTVMRWRARQLSDLTFVPTSTTYTALSFKAFTDNANFGAPTAVTQLWFVKPTLHLVFRGLKSA